MFEYDALGRVTRETGEHGELAWEYDALGNRTSVTLPDGRELKQFYYGSGHLLSIALDKLSVSDFTRDELHRETSRTQGLLTTRSEYDRLGRLHRRDVLPAMPSARRRAAGPAAGITTIAIILSAKSGTITRSAGTAGSTTAQGACSFRTARCPVRSSGAGMRPVTRLRGLLRKSRTTV